MQQMIDLGPVEIRYCAALRGIVPPAPQTPFTYARYGQIDALVALGLAASNPEGDFTFLMATAEIAQAAQEQADAMRQTNCHFVSRTTHTLPMMDFVCADLGEIYDATELAYAQDLATLYLKPNGLFACRYAPFTPEQDSLHFMVAEFAPEMPDDKLNEFLHEIKLLGSHYHARHPAAAAALDHALGQQDYKPFLNRYGFGQAPVSVAVQMIAALSPAGFSFVGDGVIQANYLELMVPKPTQDVLYGLRGHLLYEAIKDYATARTTRTDIWVKQPATVSDDLATLFGYGCFGLADNTQTLDAPIRLNGQTLEIETPLFHNLLRLMQVLPLTAGDFLSHPNGAEFEPNDVMMALHALTAFGAVVPMRGHFQELGAIDCAYPQLAGHYNQQLRVMSLQHGKAMIASCVAGRPMQLDLAHALVLQAVGRVGLAESADALMPELQRVAGDPELSSHIFTNSAIPEADFAETMIKQICAEHMVDWYALGILEAA